MENNTSNSTNVLAKLITQILIGTVLIAALAVLFFLVKITISYI